MPKYSASDVRCVLAFALPFLIGGACLVMEADDAAAPRLPTREETEADWFRSYCRDTVAELDRSFEAYRGLRRYGEGDAHWRRLEAAKRNASPCLLSASAASPAWDDVCRDVAVRLRSAASLILEGSHRADEGALDILMIHGELCADVPSTAVLRVQCFDAGNYVCLSNVALDLSEAIERRY